MSDVAAELWGKIAQQPGARPTSWTDSPLVKAHVNRAISGDPKIGWLAYAMRTYLLNRGGVERGLSLGCGSGAVERFARKKGACKFLDAYDFAPAAIEEAKALAAAEGMDGIQYHVGDLNVVDLPANHYDVVFASSAIHHVEKLERLFEQLAGCLRLGGLLIMIEYVGPTRLQFTPTVVGIMNALLQSLPENFRRLGSRPGELKQRIAVTPVEQLIAIDPSESIRSADILPVAQRYFEFIERKNFGGTIAHMLLQDIVQNFDAAGDAGAAMIDLIMNFERGLIHEGVIESDFAFVVASPLRAKETRDE